MVTLKDIAQKLGVSIRTVSHAVNNSGRISEANRKLILKTVAEMGYFPDAAARSLVTHRSRLLGVMVPFLSTSFYGAIISGLEEVARQNGYTLLLLNPPTGEDDYLQVCYSMMQRKVDGMILYPSTLIRKAADFIRKSQIPVVQLMDFAPEIGEVAVGVENFKAAGEAVREFYRTGCRHIAMISHDLNSPEVAERSRGFLAVMSELMPGYEPVIKESAVNTFDAYLKAVELLTEHPETDAVFAASDFAALGVARAALEKGRDIPDDLSIIGFDNLDIASEQLLYPFTTVAQPKEEIGRCAGKMVLQLIEGKTVASKMLAAPLILRNTTRKHEE